MYASVSTNVGITLVLSALVIAPSAASSPARTWAPTEVPVRCAGQIATVVGTDRAETIRGTAGADVIVAGAGADRVFGLGGDDVICGGRGGDELHGDRGRDRVFGGREGHLYWDDEGSGTVVGNKVEGGPGDDFLVPGRSRDRGTDGGYVHEDEIVLDAARGPVTMTATTISARGIGTDRYVPSQELTRGTPYDDRLLAREGYTYAGGGDDRIVARRDCGWCSAYGDAGDDVIDLHRTAYGPTFSIGGPGNDRMRGSRHADELYGGPGRDLSRGGPGNDVFGYADTGDDHMIGGPGHDRLTVGRHADRGHFAGGRGRDEIDFSWRPRYERQVVDARAQRVLVDGGVVSFGSVLDFTFMSPPTDRAAFVGSTRSERVDVRSTSQAPVRLLLGGGDDRARKLRWYGGRGPLDVRGGKGDDRLLGSSRDDHLLGGPGADTADGRGGADRCVAETRIRCER